MILEKAFNHKDCLSHPKQIHIFSWLSFCLWGRKWENESWGDWVECWVLLLMGNAVVVAMDDCYRKHQHMWGNKEPWGSVQFSSVTQLCPTLCDPMDSIMPGFPVHHQLLEFTQTHVHLVGDAIYPCNPLSSTSSPVLNLSQHQGLLQWVSSSHQLAKVLEFQLQHWSFHWIFRTDFL